MPRFIHAADIHLDSPLTGLAAYPDAPAERLRTATRDAFANLVGVAIEEAVDFMVIAGDLYDGAWKDHNTGIYFCRQMGRLDKAGIPVYLLFGNHDAENAMTRRLELPANVHVFETRRPTTHLLPEHNTALHGRSFKDAATTDNLAAGYPPPVPGMFNIGVLHTALEGNAAHANYAPCSLDELHAKGYQYWALGHVHAHQIWRGASTIVFPGNLQGRHARETGPRGAVLVNADDNGHCEVERLLVDVLRWHALDIDVTHCTDLPAVVRSTRQAIETEIAQQGTSRPMAMRLTLSGRSPAHGELFGREAQLRAEILAIAAVLAPDSLWIEKVKVRTSAPDDGTALRERADALADLDALLQAAESDPEFLAQLRADLQPLAAKAPMELTTTVDEFAAIQAESNEQLAELVRTIRPALLAHLSDSDSVAD